MFSTQGTHIQISKRLFYVVLIGLLVISGLAFYFVNDQNNKKFDALAYDFKDIKILSKSGENWSMQSLSDYFVGTIPSKDNITVEKQVVSDFQKILSPKAIADYSQFSDNDFTKTYLETYAGENWVETGEYQFLKSKIPSEELAAKELARYVWFNKNKVAIVDNYVFHAQKQQSDQASEQETEE